MSYLYGPVASLGTWTSVYNASLASVDVTGATFSVGGITWTFTNKSSATWGSDANGVTCAPNLSVNTGFYVAADTLLASLNGYLTGDFASYELMVVLDVDQGDFTSSTPASEFQSVGIGLGNTSTTDASIALKARSGTSPSGNGLESTFQGGTTQKTAFDLTTLLSVGTHIYPDRTYQLVYATAAQTVPGGFTGANGRRGSAVATGTGGLPLFDAVRVKLFRGSGASSAFTATLKRIRVWVRQPLSK